MSKNTSKTYCFGKADDGNIEFGETYHVALALGLEPDAKVFVREFKDGEEFLKLVGFTDRVVFKRPEKSADLPKTSNIFQEKGKKTHAEANRIWKTIKAEASHEGWAGSIKKLAGFLSRNSTLKILIWLRRSIYKSERNITEEGILQLIRSCRNHDLTPLIVGHIPAGWNLSLAGILQLGEFYRHPFFQTNSIAKQLFFLDWLHSNYSVKASVGMMSGAMDGLAFFSGRRVIFFEESVDKKKEPTRMNKVTQTFRQFKRIELHTPLTKKKAFKSFSLSEQGDLDKYWDEVSKNAKND